MNLTTALILLFVLGTIIGSFLNVVILRYNTGIGLGGRSSCHSCKMKLTWKDLVPVLSFLFLKGRCRGCGTKISKQYIVVEILTGLLFFISGMLWLTRYVQFVGSNIFERTANSLLSPIPLEYVLIKLFITLVIVSLLVVITVYDLKHKIIPNGFVYAFAIIAFLMNSIAIGKVGVVVMWPELMTIIAGPILALPFYFLWLFSGGRWMGLGDAKLALGIGWMLGLTQGISALMIAFWMGAIASVIILIFQEVWKGLARENMFKHRFKLPRISMKSEIPFAPFLIIGLLISFFLDYNIINVLLNAH